MAIPTLKMRHEGAKRYKDVALSQGIWLGLGRTAAWPDENNPPAPSNTATTIETPIGYKKFSQITFVKQDADGDITYLGNKYTAIDDTEAATLNSVLLYLKAIVEYTELPPATTRQMGVFRNLQHNQGEAVAVLPAQVTSVGLLEIIDNTVPNTRAEYQRDEYSYMLNY